MDYIIGKVCNRLVSNPHIIGIIHHCNYVVADEWVVESLLSQEDRHIELCVISKESVNAKNVYMEEGYKITIRWISEDLFSEMVENNLELSDKKILFDRTGLIQRRLGKTLAMA